MKNTDIIFTLYASNVRNYEQKLVELDVEYTTKDVLNNFWGVQFTIKKPKGKGSTKKLDMIFELFEH